MTALQTKMLLAAYDNLTATLIGVRADITRSFGPLKDSSDLRDQMDYVEDWRRALDPEQDAAEGLLSTEKKT